MQTPTKQALRSALKQRRDAVADGKSRSDTIARTLLQTSQYQEAQIICCYLSVRSEVDTEQLVDTILQQKQLVVPWCDGPILRLTQIQSQDDLERRTMGILEPNEALRNSTVCRRRANECDLIIVPGLAFTMSGDRLGYGAGYYDRLLQNGSATKMAVAFETQLVEQIPTEPTDVKMDWIVTEKRMIACH